jgi:pantoate--beta-alanine ligase
VVVIKRMVADLNFNLEIVIQPTVREADGLAMSSRNARLSAPARESAPCLCRALLAAKAAFEQGQHSAESLRAAMRAIIEATPLARLDYVSVAHPDTLAELDVIEDHALLSLAVFVDGIRLIDNMVIAA